MKNWTLAIALSLMAGALWFLLGPNSRGPEDPSSAAENTRAEQGDQPSERLATAVLFSAVDREPLAAPGREQAELDRSELAESAEATEEGAAVLVLTVTTENTGRPVPGLYVEVVTADEQDAERGRVNETDRAGKTRFEVLPGEPLVLHLNAIGVSEPLASEALEAFAPDEQRTLSIQVDEALLPRFWVRVVAAESGEPLSEAHLLEVDAYGAGLHMDGPLSRERWRQHEPLALSDLDGLAALPVSPMIQKRFAAVAEGRAPVFFIQAGNAERRELAHKVALDLAAALDVLVTDAGGRPIPDVAVRLDAEFSALLGPGVEPDYMVFGRHAIEAVTDERGRVLLDELTAGAPFRASLRSSGYGDAWQTVDELVTPFGPGERRSLTLVARSPIYVRGLALDQYGAPAEGVELLLLRRTGDLPRMFAYSLSNHAERTALVGSDGRFAWPAVPVGRWYVLPRPMRDFDFHRRLQADPTLTKPPLAGLYATTPTPLDLDGDADTVQLTLELWRGLYVRGRVVDSRGEPVVGAIVKGDVGDGEQFLMQRADEDGTFALGPLADVAVKLSADDFGSRRTVVEVEAHAGDEDVVLRLFEGGTLSVHTLDGATGQDVVCSFDAWRIDGAGEVLESTGYHPIHAEWEWDGLASGTWSVLAKGAGGGRVLATGLEVRAGETTGPIVMRLEPAGTLVITRPATGAAATGKRRVVVRSAGVPLAEHELEPGGAFEVALPAGEVEVVEYDADGEPLQSQSIDVPGSESVELSLSAE